MSTGLDSARRIYQRAGIGTRSGMGLRPAVVVVDFQYGFTDPASDLGGDLHAELESTATLLTVARKLMLPIAYTAVTFQESQLAHLAWLRKMPGLTTLLAGTRWCEIDERVAPLPGEPLYAKQAASAFFGTSLAAFLLGCSVDTVIIAGCVTSGCVRASVVDAVSWGFRTIIPAECVGDRAEAPHEANIFDMDSKYADVEPLAQVLGELESMNGDAPPAVAPAAALPGA